MKILSLSPRSLSFCDFPCWSGSFAVVSACLWSSQIRIRSCVSGSEHQPRGGAGDITDSLTESAGIRSATSSVGASARLAKKPSSVQFHNPGRVPPLPLVLGKDPASHGTPLCTVTPWDLLPDAFSCFGASHLVFLLDF